MPRVAASSHIHSTHAGSYRLRVDRFTLAERMPWRSNSVSASQVRDVTAWVMPRIAPDTSASSMNSAGASSP